MWDRSTYLVLSLFILACFRSIFTNLMYPLWKLFVETATALREMDTLGSVCPGQGQVHDGSWTSWKSRVAKSDLYSMCAEIVSPSPERILASIAASVIRHLCTETLHLEKVCKTFIYCPKMDTQWDLGNIRSSLSLLCFISILGDLIFITFSLNTQGSF